MNMNMTETKIDIKNLKREGSDVVKNLTTFLEQKTKINPEAGTDEITLKSKGEETLSRTYVRVLLKKFLHQNNLKDGYRVIGGTDNTLVIKEKKTYEEEEEE
jgi:hypothetical protein